MLRKCEVQKSEFGISVIMPEKDGKRFISCLDIRGVIVWPEIEYPGYIGVFALKNESGTHGKFIPRLLHDFETSDPTKLLKALFNMSKFYKFNVCYAHIGEKKNLDFVQLFKDYSRYQRDINLILKPAPFVKQFNSGMAILNEYIKLKAIWIPGDSIVFKHLKEVDTLGLSDTEIDKRYNSIHGLVYILGSIEKQPWNTERVIPERHQITRGAAAGFGAWT